MKKCLFCTGLSLVGVVFGASVWANQPTPERQLPQRYWKTIVPDRPGAADSINGRTGVQQLFFSDFNARMEYVLAPAFHPALGCRIFRQPGGGAFLLQVKQIANYKEVDEQLEREWPWEQIYDSATRVARSPAEYDRIVEQAQRIKQQQRLGRYAVDEFSIPISDSLAAGLYARMVGLLRYARPAGYSGMGVLDGETVTFRCVVGDELWSLRFHQPTGDYERLSDLLWEMIVDAQAGQFREQLYVEQLTGGFAQALDFRGKTVEPQLRYRKTIQPLEEAHPAGDSLADERGYEKLLFEDFRARVQYFVEPFDTSLAVGCRIFREQDAKKSSDWTLQIRRIQNYGMTSAQLPEFVTAAGPQRVKAYYQQLFDRMIDQGEGRYTIHTLSVDISDRLADRLSALMIKLLRRVGSRNTSPHPILDGKTILLRCAWGDELWSLTYLEPEGESKWISELFRELIADVQAEQLQERKYLKLIAE